jgi:hypothetical protein
VHSAVPETAEISQSDETTDPTEWLYHATSTSTLTAAQTAVLTHIQDYNTWPTDVVLTASGVPMESIKKEETPTSGDKAAPVAVKIETVACATLPEDSKTVCPFCPDKKGHGAMTCPLSTRDRYKQVMKLSLCRMCLTPGHRLADCEYKGPCTQCKTHWHHAATCSKQVKSTDTTVPAADAGTRGRRPDLDRKLRVLMINGTAYEEYDTATIVDEDSGEHAVYYVSKNDGTPILTDPVQESDTKKV